MSKKNKADLKVDSKGAWKDVDKGEIIEVCEKIIKIIKDWLK